MGELSIATIIVIGINALISWRGFQDRGFFDKFKFKTGAIKKGEKIRILSSGFLHVDMPHLIVNMITLYFFSDVVISFMGTVIFIIIYRDRLLRGVVCSVCCHKIKNSYRL